MVSGLDLIPGLSKLLDYFATERRDREAKSNDALLAALAAALETKIYLEHLEGNRRRDRRKEGDLARLWATAAVPIRKFDRDLADRCLTKADYWIRPQKWSAMQVRERRIGIEQICDRIRQLLVDRP